MTSSASAPGESASAPVPFRRLYGLGRPYARPLVLGTVLLLLGTGVFVLVPMQAGDLVDTAIEADLEGRLGRIVASLVGLFAVLAVLTYFQTWFLGAAGARLLRDLRRRLFGHLVGLSVDFYDRRRVGELLSRMASDLTVVQNALTEQIPSGLQAAVRFVAVLAILLVLHTRLTAVALLVVPPVVLFAIFYGRRLERVAQEERDAVAETTAWAEEALAGIRTVQAFSAEDQARGRYRSRLADLLGVQLHNVRLYGGFSALMTFFGFTAFALVLGYGGSLMLDGSLSAGKLTSFLLYTFSIGTSVGQLGALYAGYKRLRGSSARVFELLDQQSAIVDPPKPVKLAGNAAGLSVRSVGFATRERSSRRSPTSRSRSLRASWWPWSARPVRGRARSSVCCFVSTKRSRGRS